MTKPSEPPFALIAKQLDEGIEQAQACAALSLLISNAKDLNKLDTFCPKLIELLDHEDAAVQVCRRVGMFDMRPGSTDLQINWIAVKCDRCIGSWN